MDRLTALRTLCAVVEHGSFAAAARAIGASNAAVSKNIRELEADLGTRLLNRTTRRMSLTDAGSAYHERVCALLGDLERADDEARNSSGTIRGVLRVTAPMSLGLLTVTPLVPIFQRRHSGIKLELILDDSKADLIAERFDLAIRGEGHSEDSSLITRRLADLPRSLCAAPSYLSEHPFSGDPEELKSHNCLIYTNWLRPNDWVLVKDGDERHVRVSGDYSVNNSLAIRDAAIGGLGIASVPSAFVKEELASGALVVLPGGWSPKPQSVRILYPSGDFLPERTRVFIDFLIEHLGGSELASFTQSK